MSFKSRVLVFLQNDNTFYQLLLMGLLVASPALHYLCFDNTYDPLSLRIFNSALCLIAFGVTFYPAKAYHTFSHYIVVTGFLAVNNCVLLSANGFDHVYLFSAITIFIALTLFCTKRWEFIAICALNLIATLTAYVTADELHMSLPALVVLLLTFSCIAYVSFLVMMSYKLKFNKAVKDVVELNHTLTVNDEKLNDNRKMLTALINSLNDIIFEFNEDKICLNVWFSEVEGRVIDPAVCIDKRIADILGAEKAKKFDDAMDFVIQNRQPTSIEFPSDFGTGKWFLVKLAPVFDQDKMYTHRISASLTDISEQKKYADQLKEKEVLLLEAQVISKTGNWSYDHQTRETFWSANMYAILEVEEIPGKSTKLDYYLSLVHPDDRDNVFNYFSTVHLAGNNAFEHRLITPNGKLKYFKALKGNTVAEHGKLKRTVGVLQDVTETKLSEKKIKVSQAELMEAQSIAKIGNWKWDIGLNKLTWSDEINNIFEVVQKANAEIDFIRLLIKYIHPCDKEMLKEHLKDITDITYTSREYRIITEAGKTKYLSVIVGKIMRRDDGSVRKIIGTVQDITERKQAEIDFQQSEDKYRLILETIKMPAVSIDKNGNIIFCNRYMAEMLGYEQKEIYGLNWFYTFVPGDVNEKFKTDFSKNEFKPQNVNPVLCRNGEQRIISWQNTISYDEDGTIKEVTGIGEDITDREKATQALITAKEEAEKSSHFKSEFLSIMSHEIRTPMNAVIGTTNLLLAEGPKPDQLEYLNTLKFSGENLLAIINDILDYNKIEAGKLELNKLSFNVYHLAKKLKQSFYAKAAEKELDVELIIDNTIPEYIFGDQIRLGQVLNNFLSNAIKFTHSGRVTLRLHKEQINSKQVTIKFTVADTGIGMAPETLDIIFDPFVQESQTSGYEYGGTGLGLAITKRLIDLHHSNIEVSSQQGRGTQFAFAITFDIAEQEQKKEILSVPATVQNLQGMRILVVDDNKMNILIASKFLKRWQAETDDAGNGLQAVEKVKNNYYDLIIMDLQMPVMDGFEATAEIKKTHPHMPILALTADAMPETHSKAFAAGMCDYLTKPFVPEILFDKVAKFYTPLELELVEVR